MRKKILYVASSVKRKRIYATFLPAKVRISRNWYLAMPITNHKNENILLDLWTKYGCIFRILETSGRRFHRFSSAVCLKTAFRDSIFPWTLSKISCIFSSQNYGVTSILAIYYHLSFVMLLSTIRAFQQQMKNRDCLIIQSPT